MPSMNIYQLEDDRICWMLLFVGFGLGFGTHAFACNSIGCHSHSAQNMRQCLKLYAHYFRMKLD